MVEDALRIEIKLVPEIVIRELVANALIHQDFRIGGTSVMIEIYSDRIEISNPGDPVVPIERFIDGYQSRNERLADMMRRMRICEEKSSGIDKVVHAAEDFQLPAPDFRTSHQRTVVVIFGHKDLEKMDRNDRIRACYQHSALKWVMGERMTNQSLRDRFHRALWARLWTSLNVSSNTVAYARPQKALIPRACNNTLKSLLEKKSAKLISPVTNFTSETKTMSVAMMYVFFPFNQFIDLLSSRLSVCRNCLLSSSFLKDGKSSRYQNLEAFIYSELWKKNVGSLRGLRVDVRCFVNRKF